MGELATHLGKEAEHLSGHGLNIILTTGNDKRSHFIFHEVSIGDRLLILDTVHALDHFIVQPAGRTPTDWRGHENDIGPVHKRFIDAVELVARVPLGNGARPGTGTGAFGVKPFAGTERQIVQADELCLAPELVLRMVDGDLQERIRRTVARVRSRHRGCRNAGHANGAFLALRRSRQRVQGVSNPRAPGARRQADVDVIRSLIHI